jgi:hypothetical protein
MSAVRFRVTACRGIARRAKPEVAFHKIAQRFYDHFKVSLGRLRASSMLDFETNFIVRKAGGDCSGNDIYGVRIRVRKSVQNLPIYGKSAFNDFNKLSKIRRLGSPRALPEIPLAAACAPRAHSCTWAHKTLSRGTCKIKHLRNVRRCFFYAIIAHGNSDMEGVQF